jgi:uncharacterized membrane protein YraQ (UPF0718 family)
VGVTAAVSVAYSLWFLLHLVVALAAIVVIGGLRFSAASVIRSSDPQSLAARFPLKKNIAARVVHLAPISGFILVILGDRDVSLARAWVGVGLALYFVLAFWLEARVIPSERDLAQALRDNNSAARSAAQHFSRQLDGALLVLTAILLDMVVQF